MYMNNFLYSRVLPKWEYSHIALPVKNLMQLRVHFAELLRNDMAISNWSTTCQRVLQTRHAPLCQQTLKKGVTSATLRGPLWSYVLGSQVEDLVIYLLILNCLSLFIISSLFIQHLEHWEKLKISVLNTDLIVDKLVFKDVQLTATNDDQYFVFEDVLYQVAI